jgi:hypothetical protein
MSVKNVFLVPLTEFDIYGEVDGKLLEAKLRTTLYSHYYESRNKAVDLEMFNQVSELVAVFEGGT